MKLNWGLWLYGLGAGFIGGGAAAVASGGAAQMVTGNLRQSAIIAAVTFLVAGGGHAMAYLAQHPLPPLPPGIETERRSGS